MTLGSRLRELRDTALGRPVRQTEMATALGLQNSTISTWETDARSPNNERLRAIATYFATTRSLERSHALEESDLDDAERAARDDLLDELTVLRDGLRDVGRSDPWRFPDGAPVLIVCGAIDPADRSRYASGRDHNYMALSAYADQDALVELFGHIRAQNPESRVGFELAGRIEPDDMQAHLVVLGNLGWLARNDLPRLPVPVRIEKVDGLDGDVFVDDDGTQFRPELADAADLTSQVVEDVVLFWRTENPMNRARTLTICSGVFTRGSYAAVRLFSDQHTRDDNVRYVSERFPGAREWGVLARAQVIDHATVTPILRDGATRLKEFGPTEI